MDTAGSERCCCPTRKSMYQFYRDFKIMCTKKRKEMIEVKQSRRKKATYLPCHTCYEPTNSQTNKATKTETYSCFSYSVFTD